MLRSDCRGGQPSVQRRLARLAKFTRLGRHAPPSLIDLCVFFAERLRSLVAGRTGDLLGGKQSPGTPSSGRDGIHVIGFGPNA